MVSLGTGLQQISRIKVCKICQICDGQPSWPVKRRHIMLTSTCDHCKICHWIEGLMAITLLLYKVNHKIDWLVIMLFPLWQTQLLVLWYQLIKANTFLSILMPRSIWVVEPTPVGYYTSKKVNLKSTKCKITFAKVLWMLNGTIVKENCELSRCWIWIQVFWAIRKRLINSLTSRSLWTLVMKWPKVCLNRNTVSRISGSPTFL